MGLVNLSGAGTGSAATSDAPSFQLAPADPDCEVDVYNGLINLYNAGENLGVAGLKPTELGISDTDITSFAESASTKACAPGNVGSIAAMKVAQGVSRAVEISESQQSRAYAMADIALDKLSSVYMQLSSLLK